MSAARQNKSNHALVDYGSPFAEGTFRLVAKGTYQQGPRRRKSCVAKWFKDGGVMSDEFFSDDIKAVGQAIRIVSAFNDRDFVDKRIMVNEAQVWNISGGPREGEKVLVEPFIQNFQKWNSNSGWRDTSNPWPRLMQALSHFSYHFTSGQLVLCDLQGGVYSDSVVLTDPVILSRRKNYGVTDLGPDGIENFFSQHRCNEYCRSEWTSPRRQRKLMQVAKGTTMGIVPTQHSRPQDSYYEYDYDF